MLMYQNHNKAKLNRSTTNYTFWRRQFFIDISIAILLLLSPFMIYIHLFFNDNISLLQIFGIKIEHGFYSNQVFAWILLSSMLPFVLFAIWFFTSSKRWKYFIIPFLVVFFDRILTSLHSYNIFNDEYIPVVRVIVCTVLALFFLYVDILIFVRHRKKRLETSIAILFKSELKSIYNKTTSILEYNIIANTDNLATKLFYSRNSLKDFLSKNSMNSLQEAMTSDKRVNATYALILAIMLFLLEIHQFVPTDQEQIDLRFMTLEKYGFVDVNTFVWFFTTKFSILVSLIVWFASTSYWWRYALLSPIVLYSYQFWEVWQDEQFLDAHGNLAMLPILLIIFVVVLAMSRMVNYKAEVLDLYEYINSEIENHLSEVSISKNLIYRKKYNDLKQIDYEETMIKDYLRKLNDLKYELNKRLE